jgi:phosphopantothenate synthetase
MIETTKKLKEKDNLELKKLVADFNNFNSLKETLSVLSKGLEELAKGELKDPTKNLK